MPPSNSPLSYADIRATADRALANGRGVLLRCDSLSEAQHQRARFYKMRSIDRRESTKIYAEDDPHYNISVYDKLVVGTCNDERDGENVIFLAFEVSTAERLEKRIEEL